VKRKLISYGLSVPKLLSVQVLEQPVLMYRTKFQSPHYRIDRCKMLKWLRAFVIMLLGITVVWGLLLHRTMREYGKYEEYWEKCALERQKSLEEYGLRVDFFAPGSFLEWKGGVIIIIGGLMLVIVWIVTALSACVCKGKRVMSTRSIVLPASLSGGIKVYLNGT